MRKVMHIRSSHSLVEAEHSELSQQLLTPITLHQRQISTDIATPSQKLILIDDANAHLQESKTHTRKQDYEAQPTHKVRTSSLPRKNEVEQGNTPITNQINHIQKIYLSCASPENIKSN